MDDFITTQVAAVELGISARRVIQLINDGGGRLPAKKIGSGRRAVYLIRRADLDKVRERKPGYPAGVPRKKGKGK